MQQPRVLPVIGTRVGNRYVPDWPGAGRPTPPGDRFDQSGLQRWVAWRLLAGNGWEIARSALVFADLVSCQTAVDALRAALDRAEWITTRGLRPGTWCWELAIDGMPVAVASRLYKLQRECDSAVRTFFTILPTANLSLSTANERMASSE